MSGRVIHHHGRYIPLICEVARLKLNGEIPRLVVVAQSQVRQGIRGSPGGVVAVNDIARGHKLRTRGDPKPPWVVIAQLVANVVHRDAGQVIVVKLLVIHEDEVGPSICRAQDERIIGLRQIAEQGQIKADFDPRVARAADVLEAGDRERSPGKGLDVDVLDLIPQLGIIH
jgi:hypothetical protein